MGELAPRDVIHIGELKRFRRRSLRNPRYRNVTRVRTQLAWQHLARAEGESPLDELRHEVLRRVSAAQAAWKRGDDDAAAVHWRSVVEGIDEMIATAERLRGHELREL